MKVYQPIYHYFGKHADEFNLVQLVGQKERMTVILYYSRIPS